MTTCRLSTGELIDPFNGRQDLKDRIIRHVSETFMEVTRKEVEYV